MTQKWEVSSLAFDRFWFLNFVGINIKEFAGINFLIVVIETLFFFRWILDELVLPFLIYISLVNIWKQLKPIIVTAIIVFILIDISILHIQAELNELYEITHWFIFSSLSFEWKDTKGKNKITPIESPSPKTYQYKHACTQLLDIFCKVVIFQHT